MKGANARAIDAHNGRVWLAWNTAVLGARSHHGKSIPTLKELQVSDDSIAAGKRKQTRQAQIEAAKITAALFGGKVMQRGKAIHYQRRH